MGTFHGQLPDRPTFQREADLPWYITLKKRLSRCALNSRNAQAADFLGETPPPPTAPQDSCPRPLPRVCIRHHQARLEA